MPRKPRALLDGGYYHILTRGNDRKKLFRYKQDYKYFLAVIRGYLDKFEVSILNYCIMPNHVHLLVQARKSVDLPKLMQAILQVYANHFRNRYNSVGFVFQNRYKSCLIEKESYLFECARYIERNPLRAGIIENLFDFPWSSFSFYAKGIDNGIIKTVNPLYLGFGKTTQDRRQRYQNYILEERPYEVIVDKEFRIR